MQALDTKLIWTLSHGDEQLQRRGNSTGQLRRFTNFSVPKVVAAHHLLFTLEDTCPNKLIIGWIHFYFRHWCLCLPWICFWRHFMHQYDAPRLLHSTTDYGHKSCLEHFGALLDVNWGCRSIMCAREKVNIFCLFCCVIARQVAVLVILVSESIGH